MSIINILYVLEFTLITLGFRYIIQPTDNLTGIMIKPYELWIVPYIMGWCVLLFYIGPMIVIPWTFASIFNFCMIVAVYYLMWDCMWVESVSRTYRITLFSWAMITIGFLIFRGMIV